MMKSFPRNFRSKAVSLDNFKNSQRLFTTISNHENSYLVMTACGPDKVGITANLVNHIVNHKGNVEESRMTQLGDSFSVMMLLKVPKGTENALKKDLDKIVGVKVALDPTTFSKVISHPQWKKRIIKLTGPDSTGIVAGLANYTASKGINIDSLESNLIRASFSGYPLFNLSASVSIPPSMKGEQVEKDIDELGEKLGVDMWVDRWCEKSH